MNKRKATISTYEKELKEVDLSENDLNIAMREYVAKIDKLTLVNERKTFDDAISVLLKTARRNEEFQKEYDAMFDHLRERQQALMDEYALKQTPLKTL